MSQVSAVLYLLATLTACAPAMGSTSGGAPDAGPLVAADAGVCVLDALEGAQFTLADGRTLTIVQKRPQDTERGENTWTLQLLGADGAAAAGEEVALRPFMPAHGHATNPPEILGTEATPGRYEVGPFNLFMPGEWQLTVRVGTDVSVIILVCLEG